MRALITGIGGFAASHLADLLLAETDWQIICELAQKMGAKGFEFKNAEEIMTEIAGLSPILAL